MKMDEKEKSTTYKDIMEKKRRGKLHAVQQYNKREEIKEITNTKRVSTGQNKG